MFDHKEHVGGMKGTKAYTIGAEYDKITECFFVVQLDESEPSSYEDAKGNLDWEVAMEEEIPVLLKNETSELVPKSKAKFKFRRA